jgi:hypothetical protein
MTHPTEELKMANKQSFTPDEWTKIVESVMLAGVAVTAADPSGLFGTMKEAFASSSALMAAKTDVSASELLKALVADFETPEGRTAMRNALKARFQGAKPADITQRSIEALAEVGSIVDAKAPNEAAAFRAWLYGVSKKVSEAAKEGGFLGFGGVQVSDAEKATVDEVGKALRITA